MWERVRVSLPMGEVQRGGASMSFLGAHQPGALPTLYWGFLQGLQWLINSIFRPSLLSGEGVGLKIPGFCRGLAFW